MHPWLRAGDRAPCRRARAPARAPAPSAAATGRGAAGGAARLHPAGGAPRVAQLALHGQPRPDEQDVRHHVEAQQDDGEDQEQPHRGEADEVPDVEADERRDRLDRDAGGHRADDRRPPAQRRARRPAVDRGEHDDRADRVRRTSSRPPGSDPRRLRASAASPITGAPADATAIISATPAPSMTFADPPEDDRVARRPEQPRLAALDHADRARGRPQHRRDGRREQLGRVAPRPEDEPRDVAVDGGRAGSG